MTARRSGARAAPSRVRPPQPVRWSPVWIGALLAIVLVTVAIRYAEPVRDGDFFWQMAYGRQLLERHTLIPDHTLYSWTPTSGSTLYCAWIPEILLYLAHQALGLGPLFVFRYLCILAFVAAVFWFARRMGVARHPLVGLVALLGVLMSESAAYLKPEIFSYVFMIACVIVWMRLRLGGEKVWRWNYAFPAIMLLWVNSHGGFIFGVFFLGLMFAGEMLNAYLANEHALPSRVRRHMLYALALSALAVFITPYGIHYPLYLVRNLPARSTEDWRMVRAYMSIFDARVRHLYFVPYFATVVVILLALLWRRAPWKRFDWAIIIVNAGFAFVYTKYLRSTYYWVPVFGLTALLLLARRPELALPRTRRASVALGAAVCVLALFFAARADYMSFARPIAARWCGFGISYQNPVEETEFIRAHFTGRRLGNDYGAGGYLLWRLSPETKVMVDPRSFPYRAWLPKYQDFANGKNIDAFVDEFAADVWCINLTYERVTTWFLRDPRWTVAYYGPSSAVFVRHGIPVPEIDNRAAPGIDRIMNSSQALYVFRFALALKDWPAVDRVLQRMREHFPFPGQRRQLRAMTDLYEGSRAYERQDYAEAVRRLEICRRSEIIRDDNLLAQAYYHVAAAAWMRNDIQGALQASRSVLALRPSELAALYNISVIQWYLETQRSAPAGSAATAGGPLAPRGGTPGTASPGWRQGLETFLSRTQGQPGIRESVRSNAARILSGEYAGRPDLVIPGP